MLDLRTPAPLPCKDNLGFGLLQLLRTLSAQAHSFAQENESPVKPLESTEMAAVYIHTYKLVCM